LRLLAPYREPNQIRSLGELVLTGAIFAALWVGAWLVYSISYWLTLAISVLAAALLVRLFMIQHDCGHGAFFRRRVINDWVGRIIGVLTLTPYAVWRRSHSTHHATSSNLGKRGIGDIDTLTVREYQALPRGRRLAYRLYRTPLVIFVVGPAFQFLLRNRLPQGIRREDWGNWVSAMGTNIMIILAAGLMIYAIGPEPFLLVHLPIILLASSIGVWLFYVQHQFEDTYWSEDQNWNLQDSALHGSSHYALPQPLRWLTANIGIHHVHHLQSRIPYYRLPQVLRDYPELATFRRLTLWQSFACARLRLWDESRRKLVSFAKARE
jgi:acyl-lipid omega-6 desaturase (Delta-12 desaturase)